MTNWMHTCRRVTRCAGVLILFAAATAAAEAPDGATIASRMKQALEPAQSSVRRMTLTVAQDGPSSKVVLGQARGKVGGDNRILTVVLAPSELQGTAYLVQESAAGDANVQWAYVPAIGRVRTVVSPEAFSAFLNSDFTYADLGFTPLRSTYSLRGEETKQGVSAYQIEAVPAQQWYYSRIVTSVAAHSFLPIEREFYDSANQLWKIERFDGVATIDGVPTARTISMEDVQAKSRSTLSASDLKYGMQFPEALLQPSALPQAGKSPIWTSLDAKVGR